MARISLEEAVSGEEIIKAAREVAIDLDLGMLVENIDCKKRVSFELFVPGDAIMYGLFASGPGHIVRAYFDIKENHNYSRLPINVTEREVERIENNKYPVKKIYDLPRGKAKPFVHRGISKTYIHQQISNLFVTAISKELKGDWEAGLVNYWTKICNGTETNGIQYAARALDRLKKYTRNPLELRAYSRELGKIYGPVYGKGIAAFDDALYLLQKKGVLPNKDDYFHAAKILVEKLGQADGERTFPSLMRRIEDGKINSLKDLSDYRVRKSYRRPAV